MSNEVGEMLDQITGDLASNDDVGNDDAGNDGEWLTAQELVQQAVDDMGEEGEVSDASNNASDEASDDSDDSDETSQAEVDFWASRGITLDGVDPEVAKAVKAKFTLDGEEVEMDFANLIRQAQKSAGLRKLMQQRDEQTKRADTMQGELERLRAVEQTFAQALADEKVLEEVRKQVSERTGKPLQGNQSANQPTNQPSPSNRPNAEQVKQAAEAALQQTIRPHLEAMAAAYGADAGELEGLLLDLAGQQNPHYFGPDELDQLVNETLVEELEKAGYERAGDVPSFSTRGLSPAGGQRRGRLTPKQAQEDKVKALEAELARLKKEVVKEDLPGKPASTAALSQPKKKAKGGKPSFQRDGALAVEDDASFSDVMEQLRHLQEG